MLLMLNSNINNYSDIELNSNKAKIHNIELKQ